MIEMINVDYDKYEELCDRCDCYLEIPFEWISILNTFFDDCEKCLNVYDMKLSDIEFIQIKEKYSKIRIYYCIRNYYEYDEETQIKLDIIKGLIDLLVIKCESVISNFIKCNFCFV